MEQASAEQTDNGAREMPGFYWVAIRPYKPTLADELELQVDDVIDIKAIYNDG